MTENENNVPGNLLETLAPNDDVTPLEKTCNIKGNSQATCFTTVVMQTKDTKQR